MNSIELGNAGEHSFSFELKREILAVPPHMRCCQETLIFALADIQGNRATLTIPPRLRDRFCESLPLFSRINIPIQLESGKLVFGRSHYDALLQSFLERNGQEGEGLLRKHCAKAFLKGLFFRNGYCQDPQENYHVEVSLDSKVAATAFPGIVSGLKLPFKFFTRNDQVVAYLKSRRDIRRFFGALELFDRVLLLDDLVATRTLLGQVNRQVNFETANIHKSVAFSEKVTEQIHKLLAWPDQNFWSQALHELAMKRVQYPLDSIERLGKRFNPPLSKSAVNHRLRRIAGLYQHFFGKKGKPWEDTENGAPQDDLDT